MYRVIAYHGKGNETEVGNDLCLLWKSFCDFARPRDIRHIYCFQAVHDNNSPSPHGGEGKGEGEVNLLLVVQYQGNVAAKPALPNKTRLASQTHNLVDFWFYVRENNQVNKRRVLP